MSSRSSWPGSWRRRWTTTGSSRSRASTCRTSTRSTCRRGDREQFSSYEDALRSELQEYIAEHARREDYALTTRPRVHFETDDDLTDGVFGIATQMIEPGDDGAPEPAVEAGATMIYRPEPPPPAPEPEPEPEARAARDPERQRQRALAREGARRHRALEGLRHPSRGPERLAPPCRGAPRGRGLLARRPGLHERRRAQRQPRPPLAARTRATASRSARPISCSAAPA